MPKYKGGRGNTAPYSTTMARVPEPLMSQVAELKNRYLEFLAEGGDAFAPPKLLDLATVDLSKDELIDELTQLVATLEIRVSNQESEINELHEKNGELNLKISELQLELASKNKLVNKFKNDLNTESMIISQYLTQRELAARLGVSERTMLRQRNKDSFIKWSSTYDPDSFQWQYDVDSKMYSVINL